MTGRGTMNLSVLTLLLNYINCLYTECPTNRLSGFGKLLWMENGSSAGVSSGRHSVYTRIYIMYCLYLCYVLWPISRKLRVVMTQPYHGFPKKNAWHLSHILTNFDTGVTERNCGLLHEFRTGLSNSCMLPWKHILTYLFGSYHQRTGSRVDILRQRCCKYNNKQLQV
jgi:hypothetical protein